MIWFACRQCGKIHGRPENAVGTVVFCDCGQGNHVPWESTAAPPVETPAALPQAEPVPVPRVPVPRGAVPLDPTPLPELQPVGGRRGARVLHGGTHHDGPEPRERRGPRRDPDFCFNHQGFASEVTCDDCQERFCKQCVVELQGKTLCGPCKNHRVRMLLKPARTSGLAIAAVLTAMVAGLFGMCLLTAGMVADNAVLPLLALTPQVVACGLGVLAIYFTATRPRLTGQAMAITAVVTSVVAGLVVVSAMLFRFGLSV
jgi:hypothetical protein